LLVAAGVVVIGAVIPVWLSQQPGMEKTSENQSPGNLTNSDPSPPAVPKIVIHRQPNVAKNSSQPLTLECIPVIPQFLLHLRPAELWAGTEAHLEFATSLGELDQWLRDTIEATTTLKAGQIEELTIAVNFGSRGSTPDYCMVVRPVRSGTDSTDWLTQLVGEPLKGLADDAREYDARAWMKIDENSFVVATGDLVEELADSRYYPALPSSTMATLLKQTERRHLLTLLGDVSALNAHCDYILPKRAHELSDAFLDRLRDDVSNLSMSVNLAEHLEMRTQLVGSATTSGPQLQSSLTQMLASSPTDTLTFVKTLRPQTAGHQKLVGRLPAMMQAVHWGSTVSLTGRVVLLSTLLPPKAAANLTAAVLVSSGVRSSGTVSRPVLAADAADKPASIAEQLQRSLLIDFRREPLREAIDYLNSVLDSKIQIDAPALEAAGFTQNMPQSLNLGNSTVSAAINAMLEQYEGKLIIAANEEQTILTLTTLTAAASAGLVDIADE